MSVVLKRKYLNIWKEIIDSIKGGERDYTNIKPSKALLLLAIPMVLEMIMESIFAVVDIFFVSKLGADAVAVVGITESTMTIVYALGFGLSMATTALISRRIGEKRNKDAADTAWQSIVAGILISLPIFFIGLFYTKDILALMGASNQMIEQNSHYMSIMLGGNMIIMLLFIINAIFRSAGDAAVAMRVLWTANIINIILDPILIFGWWIFPELGIAGAAMATNIGRGIAVIMQIYILFRGSKIIKLRLENLVLRGAILKQLVVKSLGGVAQNIIATSSWIGLYRIIAFYDSTVMAGYTIAIRLVIFFILPSWGLANAASTLVGQNLGAKSPERAERSVWLAAKANVVLMGIVSLFMIFMPATFIGVFTTEQDLLAEGVKALRIIGGGFGFYALGMVMIQSHNGAGDTFTPTWIYFICFWLIEIPLAYFLSEKVFHQVEGVYWAILGAEAIMSLIALAVFMRGKWKSIEL